MSRLHPALQAFTILFLALIFHVMISGTAFACGDGSCDPKPSPVVVTVVPTGGGSDVVCPTNTYSVAVLDRVGKIDDNGTVYVTVRDGDRTVIALGGDWRVVEVLSPKRVCVTKERPSTPKPKVAPAEKRECSAEVGYVCPDDYEEKYSTPTS